MRVFEDSVIFSHSDMWFLNTFGLPTATEMVLEYKARNPLPFLYDTHQLAHFLSSRHRTLFQVLRHVERHYYPISLPKANGGTRQLTVPDGLLKDLQYRILRGILDNLSPSPFATAYIRGRQLRDNALPHCGHRYLLKMDITDFFGSIRFDQVYSAVFNTTRFPKQIGVMLTALCCYEDVLPQGAPTSPALSNLVMRRFDDYIGNWCRARGITYTRYCDDMTFSSDKPLQAVYGKVKRLLSEMGFTVNEEKTHFLTNASRQSVTGLTVNEKVTVSREYKRRLRQQVHYALTYGFESAWQRAADATSDAERYRRQLLGRVGYVLQIEPQNAWFADAFEKLIRM